MKPFVQRKSFGKQGQDILVNFLERHFGYKFEAGERYNSILNVDVIEELEHCEYVPPSMASGLGARLKFNRNNTEYVLTMPDVLMSRNSSNGFYWIEAKRHEKYYMTLIIDRDSFADYKMLYENFTRQEFYVMCINPNKQESAWDVYFCEFGVLLENDCKEERINGNNVVTWDISSTMEKLNKYPINISKYE
jgi:hypothetical protein